MMAMNGIVFGLPKSEYLLENGRMKIQMLSKVPFLTWRNVSISSLL